MPSLARCHFHDTASDPHRCSFTHLRMVRIIRQSIAQPSRGRESRIKHWNYRISIERSKDCIYCEDNTFFGLSLADLACESAAQCAGLSSGIVPAAQWLIQSTDREDARMGSLQHPRSSKIHAARDEATAERIEQMPPIPSRIWHRIACECGLSDAASRRSSSTHTSTTTSVVQTRVVATATMMRK